MFWVNTGPVSVPGDGSRQHTATGSPFPSYEFGGSTQHLLVPLHTQTVTFQQGNGSVKDTDRGFKLYESISGSQPRQIQLRS